MTYYANTTNDIRGQPQAISSVHFDDADTRKNILTPFLVTHTYHTDVKRDYDCEFQIWSEL